MTEAEITTWMWPVYLLSAFIIWWCASSLFLRGDSRAKRLLRLMFAVLLFTPTLTLNQGQLVLLPALFALPFEFLAGNPLGAIKALLPWCFMAGVVLLIDAAFQNNDAS